MSNGRLGGSASIGGFFQQKMDEIKGVDQERSKQEKLKRVHEKISDVSFFYFFLFFVAGDGSIVLLLEVPT